MWFERLGAWLATFSPLVESAASLHRDFVAECRTVQDRNGGIGHLDRTDVRSIKAERSASGFNPETSLSIST